MKTREIFASLAAINRPHQVQTMPASTLHSSMLQWRATCKEAATYFRGLSGGQQAASLMAEASNTLKGLLFGADQGIISPKEATRLIETNLRPLLREARSLALQLAEPKALSQVALPKDGTWKEKLAAVKQATQQPEPETAAQAFTPQTNYQQLVRDTQGTIKNAARRMGANGRRLMLVKSLGIIPTATTDIRNRRYIQQLESVGGMLANTYGEGTDFTVLTQESVLLVHESMLEGVELPVNLMDDLGSKLGTRLELMSTVGRGIGDTPIRAFWVATLAHKKALLEAVRFYRTGRTVQSWDFASR